MEEKLVAERKDEEERLDLWTSILKEKQKSGVSPPCPYINPAVGCKSILMSQRSLEVCTESLGSETGSDGFSSGDELDCWLSSKGEKDEEEDGGEEISGENEKAEFTTVGMQGRKELSTVNYHCSIGSRSPMRSFPPPLSSISLRGGPCIKMRPRRSNGRLVVEAVPVPSHNYLHAERHDGRLLLSFIDASCASKVPPYIAFIEKQQMVAEDNEDEEEEVIHETEEVEDTEAVEEEEVQVVDRGTIVEVKVSTQPQSLCGATAVKVHRSSLVINKFVVGSPQTSPEKLPPHALPPTVQNPCPKSRSQTTAAMAKRTTLATTTAAAAAAALAASSIITPTSNSEGFQHNYLRCKRWCPHSPYASEAKLLFASRRRSREELFHDMRRCSQLRRPLFIFEQPCCIATSS